MLTISDILQAYTLAAQQTLTLSPVLAGAVVATAMGLLASLRSDAVARLPHLYQGGAERAASMLQSARDTLRFYDRGHALLAQKKVRVGEYMDALAHAAAAMPHTGDYMYCQARIEESGSDVRSRMVDSAATLAVSALALTIAIVGAGSIPTLAAAATLAVSPRVWDRIRSGYQVADDTRRRQLARTFEADDLDDPESSDPVAVDARKNSSASTE